MPRHRYRPVPQLAELRSSLRRRGLPLVLEPAARARGLVGRAAPSLVGLLTLLAGQLMFLATASRLSPEQVERPTEEVLVAMGAGMLVMAASPLVWWVAALVLRRCGAPVKSAVGTVALVYLGALSLLGPDGGGTTLLETAVLAAVVLLGSYLGVGSVTAWAFRRAARELNHLGSMVGRVLPILMLALLFSFFNAEIWQVVAQLSTARTWAVVGVMAVLGVALATLNARDEISQIIRDYDRQRGVRDLRPAERVNITVMCVLISLIQVSLLSVVVFVFYVVFGVLSVSPATATQWIGSPPASFHGVFASLPISKPLVQVCLVLSAFSALNFIVSIGTDVTYRTTFLEPALDEVRRGLRVRDEYRSLRSGSAAPQGRATPPGGVVRAGGASSSAARPVVGDGDGPDRVPGDAVGAPLP